MVGLPSDTGKLSLSVEGALSPTAGVVPVFTAAGDIHDQNSLDHVMMYREDALRYVSLCRVGAHHSTKLHPLLIQTLFTIMAASKASYAGSRISTSALGGRGKGASQLARAMHQQCLRRATQM